MSSTASANVFSVGSMVFVLALSACGGGGGSRDMSPTAPTPRTVALPAGHGLPSRSFDVPAGQSLDVSGLRFTCTGSEACKVTVAAGANVARFTGGTLAVARNPAPDEEDPPVGGMQPAPRTVALPAGHGLPSRSFDVAAGQTTLWGGFRFTCTGSVACKVTVAAGVNVARLTGGTLTVARHDAFPDWPVANPATARRYMGGLVIPNMPSDPDMQSDEILKKLNEINPNGLTSRGDTPGGTGDPPRVERGSMHRWHANGLDYDVKFQPVMIGTGGIPLFQAVVQNNDFEREDNGFKPDRHMRGLIGYGGWMEESYFIWGFGPAGSLASYSYETFANGYVYWNYDYPDNVDNFPVGMHWLGTMIGTDVDETLPNFVQGDVRITVPPKLLDLFSIVEIDFTNIRNVNTGDRYPDMEWARASLNQGGGFFTSIDGYEEGTLSRLGTRHTINGYMTGENGEEIVGDFSRKNLTGVFGAKQHTCTPSPCDH